ncbi:MAG: hypothetical protein ACRBK7_01685 [Acidimicrobiales bacterium]
MTDPRIPPDLLGHQSATSSVDGAGSDRPTVDPLGWCVIATTALLTWLFGPISLAVLAAMGFAKYWRAWRSGAADSKCILGDVRIVLVYLAVLTVIGIGASFIRFS